MGGGGGEITLSSLEDICSSEVSDIRDLFAFFDLLFIGSDESDSELEPFLFFLFEVLQAFFFPGYRRLSPVLLVSRFLVPQAPVFSVPVFATFSVYWCCRFIDCCDYSIMMFLYLFFLQGSFAFALVDGT